MHRIVSLLSLLALATAPTFLAAQGSITGTVKDSAAGTPLASVTITVDGTTLTGHTDAAGRYTVVSVPAGTQRVRARRLGYAAADVSAVVADGQQAVVDFRLRASAVELETVVAVGYADRRRQRRRGRGAEERARGESVQHARGQAPRRGDDQP